MLHPAHALHDIGKGCIAPDQPSAHLAEPRTTHQNTWLPQEAAPGSRGHAQCYRARQLPVFPRQLYRCRKPTCSTQARGFIRA